MSINMKRTLWIVGPIIVLSAAYLLYTFVLRPEPVAFIPPNSAHDVYYDEADKFNQEVIRIAYETLGIDTEYMHTE